MSADASFAGRVVVITGAGNGLGKAYAELLASLGARVLVNNRRRDPEGPSSAEQVAAGIVARGGEALADHADISTEDGAQSMADAALAAWGRIDALICNAGFTRDKTFLKMPLDDFRAVLDVHLMGTVYCCRAVLPAMVAQQHGRIVCCISSAGLHGNFGQTNYAAAKAGVIGFMRSLDLEASRHGVRVNALAPFGATRMTAGGSMSRDPSPRYEPDRAAPAAAWLASAGCDFGGEIITAAAGYFGTAAMVEGEGVRLPAESRAPTIDELAARLDAVRDLSAPRRFAHAMQSADWILRARLPEAPLATAPAPRPAAAVEGAGA
jgi:NAD(P)-dependent dehydrogenase (short-subunit alcohol dehydrogenase family)